MAMGIVLDLRGSDGKRLMRMIERQFPQVERNGVFGNEDIFGAQGVCKVVFEDGSTWKIPNMVSKYGDSTYGQ